MTKLHITDPSMQKTDNELERHQDDVFRRYDELRRLSQTKTKKKKNPEYHPERNKAVPIFIHISTEPKIGIRQLKIGKTTRKGTTISYIDLRDDGKLKTEVIRW